MLWIVNNIVLSSYVHRNSTQIKRFCSKSERLIFLNDSSEFVKKFSQIQNLGQLGPENCIGPMCFLRVLFFFFLVLFCFLFVCLFVFFFWFVLFCFCFLFFPLLFFFLFPPFPPFFLLIAWSKFALIFHIARFQFQKYTIFSFWEGTSPSDTPCVWKHAIGADAPPNHPPMSKTDVQPSVVLVY